jgi:MoxR-like ATPase
VALLLGQPLLVTGEPGTGKTQLAAGVAYQLGLDEPLSFETKSTTTARDPFYSFDHVGRFRNAQIGAAVDVRNFITPMPLARRFYVHKILKLFAIFCPTLSRYRRVGDR